MDQFRNSAGPCRPKPKTPKPKIECCACCCCPCKCHSRPPKPTPTPPRPRPVDKPTPRPAPRPIIIGGNEFQRPGDPCSCTWCCFVILLLLCFLSLGCISFKGLDSCLSIFGLCPPGDKNPLLHNFACPIKPMGAKILEVDCLTKTCPPDGCTRTMFFFKSCSNYYRPDNILMKGGGKWCFEGGSGALTIKLGRPGLLKEIKMSSGSSILDTCAGQGDYDDAVRHFEIKAFGVDKTLKFTQSFKSKRANALQLFQILSANSIHVIDHVKLIVVNNHGASNTKIERVFVMGYDPIATTTPTKSR